MFFYSQSHLYQDKKKPSFLFFKNETHTPSKKNETHTLFTLKVNKL